MRHHRSSSSICLRHLIFFRRKRHQLPDTSPFWGIGQCVAHHPRHSYQASHGRDTMQIIWAANNFFQVQYIFSWWARELIRDSSPPGEKISCFETLRGVKGRATNMGDVINFYCPFSRLLLGENTHCKFICFILFDLMILLWWR